MAGQDLVGQLPVLATTRSAGSLGRTAPPCTGARGCLLGIRKSILNEETELMKQLFLPIALVLVLTACASSSPSNDDIGSSRLADPQYAYQDEGLRWWRRHWVQPYAFLRRVTYTGSNWVLQIAPQAQSLATLQLTCLLYTSPSPRDVEESRMPSSA